MNKLIVGIQGGIGSFNEEAARYYLSRNGVENFELKYLYTTEQVLSALVKGEIDNGQFAFNNSTGGAVKETIHAMAKYQFKIIEEFGIVISHALMIKKNTTLSSINTIMTHPQVLRQCKQNLENKYKNLKQTSGEEDLIDHATVAKYLSQNKLPDNIAVMGSKVLADIYDLRIVEDNLQDQEDNYTSFLWVENILISRNKSLSNYDIIRLSSIN